MHVYRKSNCLFGEHKTLWKSTHFHYKQNTITMKHYLLGEGNHKQGRQPNCNWKLYCDININNLWQILCSLSLTEQLCIALLQTKITKQTLIVKVDILHNDSDRNRRHCYYNRVAEEVVSIIRSIDLYFAVPRQRTVGLATMRCLGMPPVHSVLQGHIAQTPSAPLSPVLPVRRCLGFLSFFPLHLKCVCVFWGGGGGRLRTWQDVFVQLFQQLHEYMHTQWNCWWKTTLLRENLYFNTTFSETFPFMILCKWTPGHGLLLF